jgi:hypothetical protein
MPRLKRRKSGEGVEYITCRLCRQCFRSITVTHLRFRHLWAFACPVQEYRRRFFLKSAESFRTHRLRRSVQDRRLRELGTRWTVSRLSVLIRRRKAAGQQINMMSVKMEIPAAVQAARRLHGGWDALLRTEGFDPARIRLRQRRTRAGLIREGRSMAARKEDMARGAIHRKHPGFEDAVLARWPMWDQFLLSIGENPARHRKRRRWNEAIVRQAILELPRIPSTREIQRSDPGLHAAAGRYLGPWKQTVQNLGRTYPSSD